VGDLGELHHSRHGDRRPRLPVLGGARLRASRHDDHAPDRPLADPAVLQPAALRGRFPLRAGAAARVRRADRAPRRGARRAPPGHGAVRGGGPELPADRQPPQEADGLHLGLWADQLHHPLRGRGAVLLRRPGAARGPDADRRRLRAGRRAP
jgi:hypothetical protein